MSFLDSLENSLNSLEKGAEREDAGRDHQKRESDRARQQAVAPWADRLKHCPYTAALMTTASREGFKARTKVYITWIGNALRLEARERRLELRPAADGVYAVFLLNGEELSHRLLDLEGEPADLVRDWLAP
jgi:hypothetical protein